jgi:hypothetical protein
MCIYVNRKKGITGQIKLLLKTQTQQVPVEGSGAHLSNMSRHVRAIGARERGDLVQVIVLHKQYSGTKHDEDFFPERVHHELRWRLGWQTEEAVDVLVWWQELAFN